jgi:chromosome segregation ATPase
MTSIVRISASEVAGIAPMVLEQEREMSSQLAKIERLERESQACSASIQSNVGGLSNLTQLVSEHVRRSKAVGDRLRLLAFNSIIESGHLGTQAGAIWAISKSIKEVSAKWNRITDQSEQTLQEILSLRKQANVVMETLSEASSQMLREAQAQSRDCLDNLRTAAASVATEARDMQGVTDSMQSEIAHASSAGDLLESCSDRFDAMLGTVEAARRQLEIDLPGVKERYDAAEVERLFSASYTTEMERDVLHAALNGTTVPVMQPTSAGNNVELF